MASAVLRSLTRLLVLTLLLVGCGIKGPLYLPTAEQKRQAEERKQRREAAEQREAGKAAGAKPAQTAPAEKPAATPAATADEEDRSDEEATPQMPEEGFGRSIPPQ